MENYCGLSESMVSIYLKKTYGFCINCCQKLALILLTHGACCLVNDKAESLVSDKAASLVSDKAASTTSVLSKWILVLYKIMVVRACVSNIIKITKQIKRQLWRWLEHVCRILIK